MNPLQKLKARVETDAAQLASARESFRTNLAAIETASLDLEQIRAERGSLEAARGKLEGASALELHRLSLTPAQAVNKSDSLGKKASAALASESEAEAKLQALKSAAAEDRSRMEELLKRLLEKARTLSQAQFYAFLCSTIDSSKIDVIWTLENGSINLYHKTFVYNIHAERERALKIYTRDGGIDALCALADEVLSEPIPTLARAEAALPNSTSTHFMRSLAL